MTLNFSNSQELQEQHFYLIKGNSFKYKSINYLTGKPEDKRLRTGLHTTQDIKCIKC